MSKPRILPYSNNQLRAAIKMQNDTVLAAHSRIRDLELAVMMLQHRLNPPDPKGPEVSGGDEEEKASVAPTLSLVPEAAPEAAQ